MGRFMYFSDGNGANLTTEAYVAEGGMIASIVPVSVTTTAVYFNKTKDTKDKIVFTHDNKTTTSGHRCKDIAKAMAQVANAGPHHTMVDMVDLDNSIYYSNLSFITGLAITLNV